MKVLLVTPPFRSVARGNAVTVERWRANLAGRGIAVAKITPDQLEARVQDDRPDILHAHHAVHTGLAAIELDDDAPPLVLSLGGTDLSGGPDGGPDPRAVEVFRRARLILGPNSAAGERLARVCRDAAPYRVVRRGVDVPDAAPPPPDRPGLIGLVVGGIRPVKRQAGALDLAVALRAGGLEVALRFVGPAVDADYAARFAARLGRLGPDRWLGEASPEAMAGHYADADFVLNTSLHEGASNALLEAMARGRPVAASDVAGNAALLAEAPAAAACLFSPAGKPAGLRPWLARLANEDAAARGARGETAREFVRRAHDARHETDELLAAYRTVIVRTR